MRTVWLFVLGSILLGCNGSSPTTPRDSPVPWLAALIAGIESAPVTSPPSSILRYRYGGATVYFRPARCCDLPSELYDAQGTVICNPDGGITGGRDQRCGDFFDTRSDATVLWQDSRH